MFTGKHTPEAIEKIRQASLGRKWTVESRKKMSDIQKKTPHYSGKESPHWKGGIAAYQSLHDWVRNVKGVPRICTFCHVDRMNGKWIEWASVNKTYEYNSDLWVSLCRSCHRKYDAGVEKKASEIFVKKKGDTRYYGRR